MAAMSMPPDPPVLTALAECGLSSAGLSLKFDDIVQVPVVTVSRQAGGDASMFPCIRSAVRRTADLAFEDERLDGAYEAFRLAADRDEGRAVARAWFAERGMLDRLPIFSGDEDTSEITAAIERFCGLEPTSAFKLLSPSLLTLKPEFLINPTPPELECLLHTLMLVDLKKPGLRFGFIGNEAPAEDTEH